MRILIVEDEPRLLRSLAKALREEAYAVDVAAAGDDGLYKAESYDYDAIVLDIMLPVSMAGKCWSACANKSQLLC
jgi:two-component system, OmpR family, response regulator